MRFRLRTLMIVVTVVALGMAFLREVIDRTAIETAENVKRVSWLPPTASSISYYRSSSFALYEFDMSESDFLKWSRWRVEPISSVPAIVMRYGCETLPHFSIPQLKSRKNGKPSGLLR